MCCLSLTDSLQAGAASDNLSKELSPEITKYIQSDLSAFATALCADVKKQFPDSPLAAQIVIKLDSKMIESLVLSKFNPSSQLLAACEIKTRSDAASLISQRIENYTTYGMCAGVVSESFALGWWLVGGSSLI